jgi:hypothetical protein
MDGKRSHCSRHGGDTGATLHSGAACWLVAQDRNTVIRRNKGELQIIECVLANLEEPDAKRTDDCRLMIDDF